MNNSNEMIFFSYFDMMASNIHAHNVSVGWWDDPDECLFQKLQMTSTEVAEATEGARKNLMDTHLEHRVMEEVEYADTMIRALDLGGRLKLSFDEDASPHRWCLPTNTVGKQQLGINAAIIDFAIAIEEYELFQPREIYFMQLERMYSILIVSIVKVCNNRGFALYNAMDEKLVYNANRADHKRENREKENGKKF